MSFGPRTSKGYEGTAKPRKAKRAPVSRQSGGTSGDLTVKGHRTETPVTEYDPAAPPTPVQKEIRRDRKSKKRARRMAAADLRKAERKLERIQARGLKLLDDPDLPDIEDTPQFQRLKAKTQGRYPSKELKRDHPRAYRKAVKAAEDYHDEKEGLKEDPLAEALITGVATGGTGLAAKGALKLGAKGVGAVAGKVAGEGAESVVKTTARKAGKGIKARAASKAERVRTGPKRAARRVKETPERIKTAPKRAKKAASTKEGRRGAAKSAGRKAVRRPVRTTFPAVAAAPPGVLPGDADQRARAFAKGTFDAVTQHPGEVAETTAHGALGFLAGPLSVGGAAVQSVKEGSTKPLRHEIRDLAYVPESETGTGRPGGVGGMFESLASGDPKVVEETTREESGVTPFIPVPHLVRRAKRTEAYQGARGKVRGGVEARRAKKRTKRTDEMRQAAEAGDYVPRKKGRKIKHAVPDSARPGESYVNRRAGEFIEKQRSRHYISREDARMREGEMAGRMASGAVAAKLKRSKGTSQSEFNDAEVVRILGKHGIPLNEAGYAYVKKIDEGWDPWEYGDTPIDGVKLDRHATKYALEHPELFDGKRAKHMKTTLKEMNRQSELIGGHSERNRFQAQVDNLINPIREERGLPPRLKPEEMVTPKALELLPRKEDGSEWTREEALDFIVSREDDVRTLRQSGQHGAAKALARHQKALLTEMAGLMRPPKHGGAEGGVSTTKAVSYTQEMERRFVDQVKGDVKSLGLYEPTHYLADRAPKGLSQDQVGPNFKRDVPLNKIWPSRGILAKSGNAITDLETTLFNSLELPHQRKATVRGFNRVMDNITRPVNGKTVFQRRQAERLANQGQIPDSTLFVRRQALRGLLERSDEMEPEAFAAALNNEMEIGQKLAAGEQIVAELKAADKVGLKGEKMVPVDAVAMHELMGHWNGVQGVSRAAGKATNYASRMILNSIAFEASQFAAEGIPLAAALGRDVVNVPKAIASVKAISELPPETQAQIRAVVGSSSGLEGIPTQAALRSEGFLNPARVAARPRAWQLAWKIANGSALGRFDRARAGYFRETGAIAKIEGDFKRAEKGFTAWRSGASNLFKDMDHAVEKMKGMTREQRVAYVAAHPKLGDRLQKSMNSMTGNWNAFTVFEKHLAPLTVFYAFQRYAVLWTLYHFPMDHPVVATSLAMMGEANAQELQKLAAEHGGVPSPLDYTKPVINGETVLPSGQRFSSILGAPATAIVDKRPTAVLGAVPPWASIPAEAIVGENFYTGQDIDENGWAYMLRQTGNLVPTARFLGLPELGQTKSRGAQTFDATDPLRDERSVLWPYIGQTGEQFGEEKKLEQSYKDKYGEGNIPGPFDSPLVQELLFGNNGKPKPELLKETLKKIHASEAAGDYIKEVQSKLLGPSDDFTEEQKELLEAVVNAYKTGPSYEPTESSSSGSGWRDDSSSESSSGGWRDSSSSSSSGGWR